ncbi:MAG: hypothetical protein IJ374_03205 [Lachnospiraceae bacterium]|nr:hypothetical protein [Lachnospiraceae bacterium]
MKILVAGGKRTVGIIQSVAEHTKLYVDLEYLYTETYEEIVLELQKRQLAYDGILFTGASPFEYVNHRVDPLIPWEALPNTPQAFLAALLKAGYMNQWDLTKVSVDTYPSEMIHSVYEEIGLHMDQIHLYIARFQPNDPDYTNQLIAFHVDNYNSRRAAFCITNSIAVSTSLTEQQIPHIKIDPPTEIIIQQINALRLKHQLKMAEHNLVATIMVDIEIYRDQLYEISELERFRSENEAKETVYFFARNIRAAIFEISDGRFVLFTTLHQLEQYSDNFRSFPLFQNIRRSENINHIFIGIGLGADSYSSKRNADNSLIRAHRQKRDCLFLTYEDGTIAGPLTYEVTSQEENPASTANQRLLEISLRTQIGMNTLKKLESMIRQYSIEVTTPQRLSELMNMSLRNMNRLLAKLEENGYVKIVGKETRGTSGRPSRLIRFYL